MIMFALVFNGTNVAVFVALIHGIKQLQSVAEYIMNAMIDPFSLLWRPHTYFMCFNLRGYFFASSCLATRLNHKLGLNIKIN